jgi:hypothetical protein
LDNQDWTQTSTAPAEEAVAEPTPTADPTENEPVEYPRLRDAAYALSGHPQWVVDGAAAANGWDDETMLTRTDFNTAVEAWLTQPAEGVEGETAPADTNS